jgi:hypothetical protein
MREKPIATRTVNPIHFEDLDPHRFEDMVRQLAYGYRNWRTLEATGRLGDDDGIDVRGIEVALSEKELSVDESDEESPTIEERIWLFQCKRHKTITPKQIRTIVDEAVPESGDVPYGFIVAVACDVTKKTMDAFRTQARAKGFEEFDLWTKARLEDLLFQPRYDHLLFAYFGISLTNRRRSNLSVIRHRLAVKRKFKTLIDETRPTFLIRDSSLLEGYPFDELTETSTQEIPSWFMVEHIQMYIDGLIVARRAFIGCLKSDETWDMVDDGPNVIGGWLSHHDKRKHHYEKRGFDDWEQIKSIEDKIPENERQTIYETFLVKFDDILEIDTDGDSVFDIPHIFCVFKGVRGPFFNETPKWITRKYNQITVLKEDKRIALIK